MLFVCDTWRTRRAFLSLSSGPAHSGRGLKAVLAVWCLLIAAVATAQNEVTEGSFRIQTASTSTDNDVLYLIAQVDYSLTAEAMAALTSGVPLTFETQIELDRVRRFLPNPNIVSLVQRSRLTYHALTQRFIVVNLNSTEQRSYGTMAEALEKIGQFEKLPVIDISLLDKNYVYSMRMRSVLDTKSFPAPLRLLAALFRVDDWRLSSGWQRWLVTL